jgi:1-phosphatidylinositol phosphodiesterase
MSLQEQLDAGIRFLDIRCRHTGNAFAIHHESVFQGLMFGGGVRDVCINFLKAHPSECIVMSIKEEYDATDNTHTFEDIFDSYVAGLERFWYLGDGIPAMKDVRGKIVLLRRFPASRLPKGIDASPWPDHAAFEVRYADVILEIQDYYKVYTILPANINAKWGAIRNLLDRAKADTSDTWYLNFTSGVSAFAYPNAVAARINPNLSDYIDAYLSDTYSGTNPSMNKLGTLVMDFPDQGLIKLIISANR